MADESVSTESLPSKCQSLRLRSIRKRIETEQNKLVPKSRRPRERPAPLSKYRRRTANARERQRMQEVNVAFEKLKSTIPHHKLKQIDEKKDTKITTLRCAITYINSLSELLGDIENGKSVSPEYYFTDAQLGLEPENKKKKRNQRGKGNGPGRNKKDKNDRKKKKAKEENIDITKRLEHINLPHEIKMLLAKTLGKSKKFNNSSPYMIDNRPKLFKRKRKSVPIPSNKMLLATNVSNTPQETFENSVLQTVTSHDQQNVINVNSNNYTSFLTNTNKFRPVVISRRNGTTKGNKEGVNFTALSSIDTRASPMIHNSCNGVAPIIRGEALKLPTDIRFTNLTSSVQNHIDSQRRTSEKMGLHKSSPPAAVLALARGAPIEKMLYNENDNIEPLAFNDYVGLSRSLPFSTKGLQPINSEYLKQFSLDVNPSRPIATTTSSVASVFVASPVSSICPTSPSSSSSVCSMSPSLFTVNYQNDEKICKTHQDPYTISDDISEITPSLTTMDLEHQLINSLDYSNVGSIQEFLVEFENSSEQTSPPDTSAMCT